MIEEKRRTKHGDPEKEANVWLDKIAEADRQRARAQDLAIEGLLSPDELRDKLAVLEETRQTAKGELKVLKERREEVEELERDRDALLESYGAMVPEGLGAFGPEDRCWAYNCLRLNIFADSEGFLSATWAFTKDGSVTLQNPRQDEGNAYIRFSEALQQLGREDEARAAYERGFRQAEKFGHGGRAEDLRVAIRAGKLSPSTLLTVELRANSEPEDECYY